MSVHPQAKIQSRIYLHLKKKGCRKSYLEAKIEESERERERAKQKDICYKREDEHKGELYTTQRIVI